MAEAPKKRQRTCIGCSTQSDKVNLFRIVRSSDGSVSFDASGRKPGRGAYVCSLKCLEDALNAKKLQRALRTKVNDEEIGRIAADIVEAMRLGEKL